MRYCENLVIACALKKESRALKESLGDAFPVITTGLGTDRTVRFLEQYFEQTIPSLLIFTGMAGQLDPRLDLGCFILPKVWSFESGTEFTVDEHLTTQLRKRGWDVSGRGITVRIPVVKKKSRLEVHKSTGGLICDMESAAAMMVCSSYGVPCLAPKVISDTSESGMMAFYRNFQKNTEILGIQIRKLAATLESL